MAKKKRFNISLTEELFEKIEQLANEEDTTITEIFRRFVKIGILTSEVQKKPDAALILREGDVETRILFM